MKIKTNTTAKHIAVKLHTLVVEETILKYPTELSKTLQIHEYQSYVSIFISMFSEFLDRIKNKTRKKEEWQNNKKYTNSAKEVKIEQICYITKKIYKCPKSTLKSI